MMTTMERFEEALRDLYEAQVERMSNGVTADGGAVSRVDGCFIKIRPSKGGKSIRKIYNNHGRNSELKLDMDEVDLPPVRFESPEKLAVMADLDAKGARPEVYFNGRDAMFVGNYLVYVTPFHMEGTHEMGKGEWLRAPNGVAAVIGHTMRVADVLGQVPAIRAGTLDGDTLLIDLVVGEMDGEMGVNVRIEIPIVFAPWLNFQKVFQAMMPQQSVVVSASRGSLRLALAKASKINNRQADGIGELVFEDGTLSVRPMGPPVRSCTYKADHPTAPVKLVSYAGAKDGHYQFVKTEVLKAALNMFAGDTVSLATAELIGQPLVLWDGDSRMALATAARI